MNGVDKETQLVSFSWCDVAEDVENLLSGVHSRLVSGLGEIEQL